MDTDKFTDLPDWDDERMPEEEEGEEWKPNATRDACKALFAKWQEVVFLLKGVIEPHLGKEEDAESMQNFAARELLSDALVVGVKIKSSEAGGIYIIRMENASIIRKLAQGIATNLLMFAEEDDTEEIYITVVRNEIDAFRKLFIAWVHSFEKDEFEDEWGLFV
jgi:hypothetical protein